MPDGARLGARLWLPTSPEPTPAILVYIPYRKVDYSAVRDSTTIAWFASQGYACIRVDMRGSGSSDGVLYDEYSDQEIDNGVAVINWIADQDRCNGKVGYHWHFMGRYYWPTVSSARSRSPQNHYCPGRIGSALLR